MERKLRPPSMHKFHVGNVMTENQPLGILDTVLVWDEEPMEVEMVIVDDPSGKAMLGQPWILDMKMGTLVKWETVNPTVIQIGEPNEVLVQPDHDNLRHC